MSSSEKKHKKEPSPTLTVLALPEDLLLSCLARVSRLYYPTLSLVSKSFRALLASPELYKTRSLLGNTESCLYVCIRSFCHDNTSWFTLCRKSDQTLTNKNKKSSGYVLAKVSIPDSPHAGVSDLVAVGSSIYNIGGSRKKSGFSSSSVSILDCTSYTWRKAPNIPVMPLSVSASVFDRKIYVAGHYIDNEPSLKNMFQVLDTKTQIWDHTPIPCNTKDLFVYPQNVFINGKFHVKNIREEVFAYDSKEDRWDMVGPMTGQYMNSKHCVIENVLYSVSRYGDLEWYHTETELREVKGLVGLPKFSRGSCVRLADYGGKMVVLWEECTCSCTGKMIWCAEIALERRKSCEIWGTVEWVDLVLTVPLTSLFLKCLAVTLW